MVNPWKSLCCDEGRVPLLEHLGSIEGWETFLKTGGLSNIFTVHLLPYSSVSTLAGRPLLKQQMCLTKVIQGNRCGIQETGDPTKEKGKGDPRVMVK